jgi:hypothetical protein
MKYSLHRVRFLGKIYETVDFEAPYENRFMKDDSLVGHNGERAAHTAGSITGCSRNEGTMRTGFLARLPQFRFARSKASFC